MTLSSLMFEMVEMSSSVIPSAKYSSFESGEMFAKGRTAILLVSGCADGIAFSSLQGITIL